MPSFAHNPWKVLHCGGKKSSLAAETAEACSFEFSDPDYNLLEREAVYYVRAIQQATPTINGSGLRCEYDGAGVCTAVNLCYGHNATDRGDDCLSPVEHRAWSSPIYLAPDIR